MVEIGSGHPDSLGHICLDQAGLICFIKYLGLTWILYWIMASGIDQSDKLSVLDGDDGSVSPDSPQCIDCTIRVL